VRPLVIVPTFNERDNLPRLLPQLLAIPDLLILVVDDASHDGTAELADLAAAQNPDRVSVLHRRGARGLGRSYIDGMRLALATNADVICQMDADLSHLPSELHRLLAATADADLVIGSRYVHGGRIENWPRRRMLLSAFANHYVRLITRLSPHDVTSGFRAWRRDLLFRIPLADLGVEGYAARGRAYRRGADHVRRTARGKIEAFVARHPRIHRPPVAARPCPELTADVGFTVTLNA
jgi:dolichol-phosphate mannosyltransferase